MKESLPWKIKEIAPNRFFIYDQFNTPVAEIKYKIDAEFICRAHNSHYDLLEACKKALIHTTRGYAEQPIRIREQLRQAIAKAEGK